METQAVHAWDGPRADPRMLRWASDRETRTATYRGVRVEIVRWRSLSPDGVPYVGPGRSEWTWNYYLYLPLESLPERLHPEFNRPPEWHGLIPRPYYRAPEILSALYWHGGITLFDKLGGVDDTPITFKAGCDYAHGFDLGVSYTFGSVEADARRTVDDLWKAIPDLRIRCSYYGDWVELADGFWTRDGEFLSFRGARAIYEWQTSQEAPMRNDHRSNYSAVSVHLARGAPVALAAYSAPALPDGVGYRIDVADSVSLHVRSLDDLAALGRQITAFVQARGGRVVDGDTLDLLRAAIEELEAVQEHDGYAPSTAQLLERLRAEVAQAASEIREPTNFPRSAAGAR